MDAKRKRLREIMCELQGGAKGDKQQKRHAKKDSVIVNYHGPYVDSSGEKFYLPRKWTLCPMTSSDGKMQHRYKECSINYSFKLDEMKGGDLMKNLWWLHQFGCLRTLLDRDSSDEGMVVNDNECNNDDNEEYNGDYLVQRSGNDLIGGSKPRKRQRNDDASYKFEEERNIRRAMPEVEGMLGNWTLHRQNLRTMLKNYKRQYRHPPPDHRRELGQFFNTTSTVLDTIRSMTENAILRPFTLKEE